MSDRYRAHLIKAAEKHSLHPRYQHAALVAKGKQIISEGVNNNRYHAEANALFRADAKGATLYTLMVKKTTGLLGNGSPCAECMDLMREAGIRKVVVYL